MTACEIVSSPLERYCDGPRGANIPRQRLCRDCADDLTEYLQTRARADNESSTQTSNLSLTEDQIDEILQLVKTADRLLLTAGEHFGIRYIDGEWREAYAPRPAPPQQRTLFEDDVIKRITEARELSFRLVSEETWNRFDQSHSRNRFLD